MCENSKSVKGRWSVLIVLTCVYVTGELSHFLLGTVSRPMAQELKYGTVECIENPKFHQTMQGGGVSICHEFKNESSCQNLVNFNSPKPNNKSVCIWEHSGLGFQYQILAGPSFIAVFTLTGIIWGIVGDKFSRPFAIKAALCLLAFATTLSGATTAYWQLVILRMLIGAGDSAITPVSCSMLSSYFDANRRGLAIGIFSWGIYLGYGLSYALGNLLTEANVFGLGWRFCYYVSGGLALFAFICALFIIKEPLYPPNKNKELTDISMVDYTNNDVTIKSDVIHNSENEERKKELQVNKSFCAGFNDALSSLLNTHTILLISAACVRHTAGFTWAYNTQLYFNTYYPKYNLGIWISSVSIVGGSLGVAIGGLVSDKLVKKLGLKARLYVLAASQLLATPFAVGVLYFQPPGAFLSLLLSYLFAEMWFGVLFASMLDIFARGSQSTSIAIFIFIMNNVGGNTPIIVEPLRAALTYRAALYIMYPGLYFLSSLLFLFTSFLLPK